MAIALIRKRATHGARLTDSTGRVLILDATLSSQADDQAQITRHPVEAGADVTDHIQPDPPTLSLQVVVSNTPLRSRDPNPSPQRAEAAYELLLQRLNAGVLWDIVTPVRIYESMALGKVGNARGRGISSNELRFSLEFVKIRIVAPSFVKVLPEDISADAVDGAASEAERGNQEEDLNEEEEDQAQDWALQILGSLGVDT
jgi:hypothetical protein